MTWLYFLCYIEYLMLHKVNYDMSQSGAYLMPRGTSGRIVIEIDPVLKDDLYEALQKEGLNLKSWFLENVQDYLSDRSQLKLFITQDNTEVRTSK